MLPAMLAAFACGVVVLQTRPALPESGGMWALAAAIGALLVAWARYSGRGSAATAVPRWARKAALRTASATLVLLVFATGFGYAAWRAQTRLADALAPDAENIDIRVVGVVDDLPQNGPQGARFAFAVEHVLRPQVVVPTRLSLAWFTPRAEADAASAIVPEIHAGERWRLTVRLKRPRGYANPAGFDLEAWLLEHELRATGYVRDSVANERLAEFVGRPSDYVQRMRESVRARIFDALAGAPYAGVMAALAIGDQRAIPETQWQVFNRTGVSHLISISGLHVTVFAALAAAIALAPARRVTRLTTRLPARKIAVAVGAASALGYVLLAGAEVPAVRTLLMLWVASFGLWLGRPGTAALVWLWALAIVLVWDPWASLSPGFWLSFGAVGLLLYAGTGRLAHAPVRGAVAHVRNSLREGAHAQWVVTLGLVPGTLALFQQVSLVSALANAVAIPVVTLGVVPLALLGIALPLDILWQFAHAVFAALMVVLETLSASPVATWAQHAPPGWTVAVAMLGIVLILAPRGVPGRWLGGVWLLPLFAVVPERPPEGAVRLTTLDVGQGLAVAVETRTHALLYDTGPRFGETADAGGRVVAPYLRARGIRALDAMVVSHADLDHAGGALSLLQTLPVTTLYSSLAIDHAIVSRAAATGTAWRCQAGQRWQWDGVEFEMLSPPIGRYAIDGVKTNDLSCVLRIAAGTRRALIAGDIEAISEAHLLREDARSIAADVLVVPHHGSRTSSTPAFVAAVAPRVAVFAAGYLNRFNHPRPEVVDRYVRQGAAVMRTDRIGAVSATLGPGDALDADGERDRNRRYWYDTPPATR